MTNLRDPESKLRIKKPTDFVASDGKTHHHARLVGTYKGQNKTHLARTWTWELASLIAAGVSEVVKRLQLKAYVMSAYPVQDKAREAAAKAAMLKGSEPLDSSTESSETESESSSSSSNSTVSNHQEMNYNEKKWLTLKSQKDQLYDSFRR